MGKVKMRKSGRRKKSKKDYVHVMGDELIRKSEIYTLFGIFTEESPHMFFINRKGRIVYANKKCEEVMGYKRAEMYAPNFDFLKLISRESRDLVRDRYLSCMRGEELSSCEIILQTKDGRKLHTILAEKPIDYKGERIIVGIVVDITKQKDAERTLIESEASYRLLVDNINDGIYILNTGGNFVFVNKVIEERSGIGIEEFRKYHLKDVVTPEYRAIALENFNKVINGEQIPPYELEYQTRKGYKLIVEVNTKPIYKNGKITGLLGISRDVTNRKKAELALQKSEEMYRKLLISMYDGVSIIDLDGNVLSVSGQTIKLFGFNDRNSIIGINSFRNVSFEYRDRARKALDLVKKTGIVKEVEIEFVRADRSRFYGELNAALIKDNRGNPESIIVVIRDITERKRLEEEARKKMLKFDVADGNIYLAKEEKPSLSLMVMGNLSDVGYKSFIISRSPLGQFSQSINDFVYIWMGEGAEKPAGLKLNDLHEVGNEMLGKGSSGIALTSSRFINVNSNSEPNFWSHRKNSTEGGEGNIGYTEINSGFVNLRNILSPELGDIEKFFSSLPRRSAVLFDRLDYLFFKKGFNGTLNLVQSLRDIAYSKKLIIIFSMDPNALRGSGLRILEKETKNIELKQREKLPEDLFEILKYIYRQNCNGIKPNYTDIRCKLGMSKPTATQRIKSLISKGYVASSTKGRYKVVELTEKGMRMFSRV